MQENIPSYSELHMSEEDYQKAILNKPKINKTEEQYISEFMILCNKPISNEWLKKTKVSGGREIKYIPIYKLKFLLTRLFGPFWRREILSESLFLNSITVRVRLHYKIPGTNIWLWQDGAGAVPIQIDSKDGDRQVRASELSFIKSTAVQQGYPSATSFALSNAAELLGEMFGANLNKDDAETFAGVYDPNSNKEATEHQPELITVIQPQQNDKLNNVTLKF